MTTGSPLLPDQKPACRSGTRDPNRHLQQNFSFNQSVAKSFSVVVHSYLDTGDPKMLTTVLLSSIVSVLGGCGGETNKIPDTPDTPDCGGVDDCPDELPELLVYGLDADGERVGFEASYWLHHGSDDCCDPDRLLSCGDDGGATDGVCLLWYLQKFPTNSIYVNGFRDGPRHTGYLGCNWGGADTLAAEFSGEQVTVELDLKMRAPCD